MGRFSMPPKTQKALNNQGFEYGGSVEIRLFISGDPVLPIF